MIGLQAQANLLFVETDPGFTFSGDPNFDLPQHTAVGLATLPLRSIADSFAPFSESARSLYH